MPKIERTANIAWDGNLARGAGAMSAATGAFSELGYSLATRIGQPEGKTSPEELLAAAHGGCITMSLAERSLPTFWEFRPTSCWLSFLSVLDSIYTDI